MFKKIFSSFKMAEDREEFAAIEDNITKGVVFRGTNLWVLIFAIFIASVGLNINSTAVIIGAMLVSPLMGPIIGIGFGIATYNFPLFRKALYNFGFSIVVSLLASTLYFILSPLNDAHSEILARTSPTIYDVIIAGFGGIAGIVAVSSKLKGNVLPGVAIATALMPPLCTAGYGLATLQWNFFLGAFYLFAINTVFISLATLIFTRVIKFPMRHEANERLRKISNRAVTIIVIVTVIPSIYLGYILIQKDNYLRNANQFILEGTKVENNYLLKGEVDPDKREITLTYGGKGIDDLHKEELENSLVEFGLRKTKLIVQQGFDTEAEQQSLSKIDQLNFQINQLKAQLAIKEEAEDSITSENLMGQQILKELQPLYPQIHSCSMAKAYNFNDSLSTYSVGYVIHLETDKEKINDENTLKIKQWLAARLNNELILLTIEPSAEI